MDVTGAVTVTAGVVLLLLALIQGGREFPWGSWQILSMFGGAAALLAAFLWIERRVPEPALDLGLFRNRTFAVMSSTAFLMGGSTVGVTVFGVVFNHEMSRRFASTLGPLFARLAGASGGLPAQAVAGIRQMAQDPQAPVQVLLQGQVQARIPPALRTPLVAGVKEMISLSLHTVFGAGAAVVLVGLVLAQFLGNTSLPQQVVALGEGPATEVPLVAG